MFEMNEIILKACMQDAKARYQTCDEMHADLALLSQGKSVRQKRIAAVVLVLLVKSQVSL